ncbi:hypothetical protein HN018_19330 [Lichenicola cladoniae]|uniref:Uncharacterized protein n=1 Tax=Lichenicola cladoniae TaxID=1484109 RepID=A0A6M8HU53_9PROT|nr:hypothetical protein [Lichenicola cladoniae]NPD68299.1 hypothetical protein [Acetobacteraceae bacterium]QKE91898.1 hypothetical protein HN018_19330 [Lichenicola cladoniae]
MARTTRRDLLGAGVGTFTFLTGIAAVANAKPDTQAGEAVPTPRDDAELIIIGREAADLIEKRRPLEARWWALPADTRQYDNAQRAELYAVSEAMQPIDDRLSELSDRSVVLRAFSRAAMIAKAHLIRHEMEVVHVTAGVLDPEMFDPHEAIVWSLLEDLLGGSV